MTFFFFPQEEKRKNACCCCCRRFMLSSPPRRWRLARRRCLALLLLLPPPEGGSASWPSAARPHATLLVVVVVAATRSAAGRRHRHPPFPFSCWWLLRVAHLPPPSLPLSAKRRAHHPYERPPPVSYGRLLPISADSLLGVASSISLPPRLPPTAAAAGGKEPHPLPATGER